MRIHNNYITKLVMSSDVMNGWNHTGDLESYSFDDFYEKNESTIKNSASFDIDLSVEHIHFQYEHGLLDTKMETHDSDHSHLVRDTEDYFCLNDLATPLVQLHQAYQDPPNYILHSDVSEEDSRTKQKREKKIKKPTNPRKNQYDKNIFANINAVILKKLVAPQAEWELRIYCKHHQILFEDFLSHFMKLERNKFRFGTTQLSNFYESRQVEEGWKQVFGMFSVRFLREEYVQYVLREGRMQEREKYLRCATKMMYIPRLRKEEYHIISCLMNKVVDI